MTPEQHARNARILYESLNRSTTVNDRSFENVVASAIRDARREEREACAEWVSTHEAYKSEFTGAVNIGEFGVGENPMAEALAAALLAAWEQEEAK